MTEFLLRLFIKDYQNTESPAVRSSVGKLAGKTGILCNILLFSVKLTVGFIAGSVSIVADAVNNLSDAFSSLVTFLGFRLAQRPADADHPYGHARYEYISGLVVSALILLMGTELVKSSVSKIFHPASVEFSNVSLAVLVFSICIKLWMFEFYRLLGKRINSTALKVSSADSRNDIIATLAVLVGCLSERFLHWNIDAYVGLAVAVFILYSGVCIARETISPLLGKQADSELIQQISHSILSHEKILGIHDLLVHDYGPGKCFASVHAELNANEESLVCHDVIDSIERDVLEKFNVNMVIHYDPVVLDDSEWNDMQITVRKIIEKISPELSMHDFRLVKDDIQTKIVFDLAVPYSMKVENNELKERIDVSLSELGKHYVTVINFDGKA